MTMNRIAECFFFLAVCVVAACGFDHPQRVEGLGPETSRAKSRDIVSDHPSDALLEDAQAHQLIGRLDSLLNPPQLEQAFVAQNIVGTDTDGVEFELEDYRGNIVVLVFSGEWCGPCRAEYPYQEKLMETYRDEPVVLLGVNSDRELETIREAKASGDAPGYRTWWDGSTNGPISNAWEIRKWPSTFILDADGVVRFVGKRKDGMIEAVAELLEEQRAGDWKRRN